MTERNLNQHEQARRGTVAATPRVARWLKTRNAWRCGYCVAVLVFAVSGAFAQIARNLPDTAGKQLNQGVYVRDSGGAVEKLALAQRMERLKEWDKAADVYQEVLDKY